MISGDLLGLRDLLGAIWRRGRILTPPREKHYHILGTDLAPQMSTNRKKQEKNSVQKAAQKKYAPGGHPKRPNV